MIGHGDALDSHSIALVGFPSDRGVERNGGRPGAALGPDAIRRCLYRLTPDPRGAQPWTRVCDRGNVVVTGAVERDQEVLGEVVGEELGAGRFVVVLGGGHETSYGHFLGYVQVERNVSILNVDAHPDVRPLLDGSDGTAGRGHSGSPFRQCLEHPSGLCRAYDVVGLQPSAVAGEHLRFLEEHDCGVRWIDAMRMSGGVGGQRSEDTLLTLDLDAIDAAYAPGVSAPCSAGFDAVRWLEIVVDALRARCVRSVDIVELSPPHDLDDRTARLAARTVWTVVEELGRQAKEPA